MSQAEGNFSAYANAAQQQLLYLPLFSWQTNWCVRDSDSKASDSLLISGEQNSMYEKAAESLKKVFGSGREQEIFLGISKRYCQRESVVEAEQKKKGHRDQYFVNKTLDEEEKKKNYCCYKKKWLS